jgi:hypothetical protein
MQRSVNGNANPCSTSVLGETAFSFSFLAECPSKIYGGGNEAVVITSQALSPVTLLATSLRLYFEIQDKLATNVTNCLGTDMRYPTNQVARLLHFCVVVFIARRECFLASRHFLGRYGDRKIAMNFTQPERPMQNDHTESSMAGRECKLLSR